MHDYYKSPMLNTVLRCVCSSQRKTKKKWQRQLTGILLGHQKVCGRDLVRHDVALLDGEGSYGRARAVAHALAGGGVVLHQRLAHTLKHGLSGGGGKSNKDGCCGVHKINLSREPREDDLRRYACARAGRQHNFREIPAEEGCRDFEKRWIE